MTYNPPYSRAVQHILRVGQHLFPGGQQWSLPSGARPEPGAHVGGRSPSTWEVSHCFPRRLTKAAGRLPPVTGSFTPRVFRAHPHTVSFRTNFLLWPSAIQLCGHSVCSSERQTPADALRRCPPRPGLGQATPSRAPMWLAGAQVLEPWPAASRRMHQQRQRKCLLPRAKLSA